MPIKDRKARNEYKRAYMRRYHADGRDGRTKPELFPPCEAGRHEGCGYRVFLAGYVAFRCLCPCHEKGTHEKPKPDTDFKPDLSYPCRVEIPGDDL